jgi:multiple sugar transport system substrate-binding protein
MKRAVRTNLTFLLAFIIVLTGCSQSNQPSNVTPTAEGSKPSPEAGAEKIKLRMTTWSSASSLEMQQSVLDKYMKEHPNVSITFESVPNQYSEKLLSQFAIGDAPDIIMVGDSQVPLFAKNGGLADLTAFSKGANGINKNDFYEDVLKFGMYKDKLYAMPKDWTNMAVIYNKKLFDEAKLPYPEAGWTWEQMYDTAKKLTKRDGNKTVQWGLKLPGADQRRVHPLVFAYSDGIVSPDGQTYEGYMNSKDMVKAMQLFNDAYHKDKITPSSSDTDSFKGIDLFASGKVAMELNGRWPIENYLKNPELKFGTVSLPAGPKGGGNVIFYGGWGIYEKSKNKDAAWDVIKFMSSKGGAETFGDFAFVGYKPVAEAKGQPTDPNFKAFMDDMKNIKIVPEFLDPDYPKTGQPPFKQVLEKLLLSGNVDIQKTLDEAAAEATANKRKNK